VPPRVDIDVYSIEEVMALVRAAADGQDAAIFLTAAFTGLRMGELMGLRWRDVDFIDSAVRVRQTYLHGAHDESAVRYIGGRSSPRISRSVRSRDSSSKNLAPARAHLSISFDPTRAASHRESATSCSQNAVWSRNHSAIRVASAGPPELLLGGAIAPRSDYGVRLAPRAQPPTDATTLTYTGSGPEARNASRAPATHPAALRPGFEKMTRFTARATFGATRFAVFQRHFGERHGNSPFRSNWFSGSWKAESYRFAEPPSPGSTCRNRPSCGT
jgi:hypothetical protein